MQNQVQRIMTAVGHDARGMLMAIGGAEDKVHDRPILRRFVALAGGAAARIAIVPTASSIEEAGQRYKSIFLEFGAATAEVTYIPNRAAALDPRNAALLAGATGIFLGGGNQLRLAAILGGSPIAAAIVARHLAGAIIAGTSAGASILSRHMVAFGASGTGPRSQMAQLGAGFGLIDDVIIDQHFRERDRIGRLLTLVALNPGQLGLGIDEDTAALIAADGTLEVLGRGTVMVVDGQLMTSDIAQQPSRQPLNITDVTLHALASGARYDLRQRRPLALPAPSTSKDEVLQAERRQIYQAILAAADDDAHEH